MNIMECFKQAMDHPSTTTTVKQTILNLAEFMELDESTDFKIFTPKTIAQLAEACNAYAKALYYWEQEYENPTHPGRETIEALIKTNQGLGQPEAALGILEYAQKKANLIAGGDILCYESLNNWPAALKIYREQEKH